MTILCFVSPSFFDANVSRTQALLRGCRCLEIDVWDGDATSSSSTSSSSLDDSSSTGDPSRKSTTSSTKTKRGYVRGTASKAFHKLGRVGTRMKDIMVAEVPPDGETEDDDTAGGRVSPSVAKTEEKKKKKKKHGASAFSRLNPLHSRAGTEDDESQSRASATVPTQSLPIRPTVPTPTTISTAPQPAPGPAPAPAPAHASTSNPPQPQAALGVSESTTIVKPTATIQRPVPNDPHQPTWALDETSSPQEMRAPLEVEAIEPVVLHGHTLTSSVTFRSVCETIHKTAFIASTLPLIVSLEVHASHQQQQVMVDIMKEVWGESLLADAPEEVRGRMKGEVGDVGVRDVLPSPKQLRGKILVKVKPGAPREVMEEIAEEAREAGKELDILVSNDPEENTTTMRKASSAPAAGGAELAPTRSIDTESAKDKQKAAKILPSLGELGIYTAGYSFKNLFVPEANIPHHMFSLSEAAVKEAHKSHRLELFEHNRNYMMRSYPSGMRIGSSNPDPAFCWRQGIQFAALNWQKKDKGMMLNIGMFAGTEGYVLKPEEYRGDEWRRRVASGKHQDTNGNPDGPNTVVSNTGISKRHTVTLAIEVFAGQNIPPPPGDSANSTFNPYIVCKLNAACADDSAKAVSEAKIGPADIAKVSLKTPSKVGMDPDFEGKRLAFPTCHNVLQELSFLR